MEVTEELIIPDSSGLEQVFGLPLYVDSLALFYNKDHLEEAIPSRGRPSDTWVGIQNDAQLLNRADQSFERFERSGIAMGRADNVLRAFDAIMTLFLQSKSSFYNDDLTEVNLANNSAFETALELYTGFSLPSQAHYSWNAFLADPDSGTKELTTFASGKTSMILGYSFTYDDVIQEINRLSSLGRDVIDPRDVRVQEIPQILDVELSSETREAFASYYVPVVSRTSENADLAWSFLASLADEDFLTAYFEETHRPSALRSLISEQQNDPIYGVFATQVGYASSIPLPDAVRVQEILLGAIDDVLSTVRVGDVLRNADSEIQSLIPQNGLLPQIQQ